MIRLRSSRFDLTMNHSLVRGYGLYWLQPLPNKSARQCLFCKTSVKAIYRCFHFLVYHAVIYIASDLCAVGSHTFNPQDIHSQD